MPWRQLKSCIRVERKGENKSAMNYNTVHRSLTLLFHGDPPKDGCTNDDCCNGDDSFSGRKSGTVGISSKMCCTTPGGPDRPCNASSARMTPWTRASCDGASSQAPLGPGATGGIDAPRPSQMHRRSLPGMTWQSRPVSTCRTSMKRESKMRMYGGCHATCSAVPSHSIVPFVRLGSPWRFTYNPNSERRVRRQMERTAERTYRHSKEGTRSRWSGTCPWDDTTRTV